MAMTLHLIIFITEKNGKKRANPGFLEREFKCIKGCRGGGGGGAGHCADFISIISIFLNIL